MVTVVVGTSIIDEVQALLDEASAGAGSPAPAVQLLGVDEDAAGADVSAAEAAIRWDLNDDGFQRLLDDAPNLRWLHSPGAGVERWPLDQLGERNITLTNAAGVFAIPIAEWVLTTMLTVVKQTHAVRQAQHERRWAPEIETGELYGKSLLVLGSGGIGQETINRAAAFGMRIWAANRSGRPVENAERSVQGDAWRDLLPESDFVVSTIPLTSQTRHMIGAAELRLFRPGAWLINVGRGATVDEEALLQALREGSLGGAALDAWTTEPLPAEHWAWALSNVVVSPHMSGNSPAGQQRGLRLFVDNLRRFLAGQPLTNVVDLSEGY